MPQPIRKDRVLLLPGGGVTPDVDIAPFGPLPDLHPWRTFLEVAVVEISHRLEGLKRPHMRAAERDRLARAALLPANPKQMAGFEQIDPDLLPLPGAFPVHRGVGHRKGVHAMRYRHALVQSEEANREFLDQGIA